MDDDWKRCIANPSRELNRRSMFCRSGGGPAGGAGSRLSPVASGRPWLSPVSWSGHGIAAFAATVSPNTYDGRQGIRLEPVKNRGVGERDRLQVRFGSHLGVTGQYDPVSSSVGAPSISGLVCIQMLQQSGRHDKLFVCDCAWVRVCAWAGKQACMHVSACVCVSLLAVCGAKSDPAHFKCHAALRIFPANRISYVVMQVSCWRVVSRPGQTSYPHIHSPAA